jgi:uncharacterized protein YhbP (UPF0306 family)
VIRVVDGGVPIERSNRPLAATRIAALARELLEASALCAVATVSPRGRAHVNTAYFAWDASFDIVWLSERSARHSRNLRASPSVAVAVYDSSQTWGEPDRGIQLFGDADESAEARDLYVARFPQSEQSGLGALRFYRLRPRRLKLFDERVLGSGVFVTARVAAGSISWERTEVYR